MKNYTYQNNLVSKKQLRQLLAWSFSNYDSMQASSLADELKYLGFKYASQAGISISIEDLKIPFVKNLMLEKANQEIINAEKIYLKGKITDVERFQKIIDTWSLTSESLKEQVISYFKNYDPLNSVYIMAFSGARGNLSQVRQLVGMRGLMSDPSGEIMNLPIKKNFREGLTITDYLMSGYGARKGIVDTALKTANSGYLTRRLIDVGHDILIREKDCFTVTSFFFSISKEDNSKSISVLYEKVLGRILNQSIFDFENKSLVAAANTQITSKLLDECKKKKIKKFYIRSPLTCNLYRSICQKCYGWDLANENLVDIGEAVGILAGQSIGEPGTQLTMRTFHTGGIFTSEARQQIISPLNGIVKFYKSLKTVLIRTNRGEDVLITKNSGSLLLIPENKDQKLVKIQILRNTILFPKNNQYISKDTVIGELINTNKQIKTEIKPIVSNKSGEIFMPHFKKKVNLLSNNKLLWILSGYLYNSPINSFINFYPDYKLIRHSYIFRTKLINHYQGIIEFINNQKNLYQRLVQIKNKNYFLINSNLYQLTDKIKQKNYLLKFGNLKYLLKLQTKNCKFYLQLTRAKQIGTLITNKFCTLTGGILYYDVGSTLKEDKINSTIFYLNKNNFTNWYKSTTFYRTIIWLGEETYKVDCDSNVLFVEQGDFISKGFEIIPNVFSKTSGLVTISERNKVVQTISIKSGLVYEGKRFKNISKKIYYSGEIILSKILVKNLVFCEHIIGKTNEQLLVRPIEIYEFPYLSLSQNNIVKKCEYNLNRKMKITSLHSYNSNQVIKGNKNLDLIANGLTFKSEQLLNQISNIEILADKITNSVHLLIHKRLYFNNYIVPQLRYKHLKSSLLIQKDQFIDKYAILGYLESTVSNSLEIVKFKVKSKESKQILLISNKNCVTVEKSKFPGKKVNDFVINNLQANQTGKIILENRKFLTLQRGRPYFFPNCKNEDLTNQTSIQYKVLSSNRLMPRFTTHRQIFLNYYDLMKFIIRKKSNYSKLLKNKLVAKAEFSKLFLKKSGKLFSSLIPRFFKQFSLNGKKTKLKYKKIIEYTPLRKITDSDSFLKVDSDQLSRTLLLQNSEIIQNNYKSNLKNNYQLMLVKVVEHIYDRPGEPVTKSISPLTKSAKSIGLYAITEDYFEQDVNSVFCKNSQFIENGETIGLLNLEKEITGDIVQGLPRIEEILEARKKNLKIKRIPTSQKKGLLIQKTNLDPNFEFRKLGTAIKENETINPHKLLKVYFNYYGLIKIFLCDKTKKIQYSRLVQNYEGSYKSFKKVQSFILNSVQSIYQSQGVTINDKHLEVIIKQMTHKVLITSEGNTPLLRKEVIDLYHIQYINQIIERQGKKSAYYVPLLLGITKAALNNPSFISAASFQETTRVLTKAAIEGRIDWLRGLKENVITGHLIPAGTGSQNYKNSFKNQFLKNSSKVKPIQNILNN